MTLTLIDRVRYAQLSTVPARLAANVFALAPELCRRPAINRRLTRLGERDLRDLGLTLSNVDLACSSPLAQDAATELYTQEWLRLGNR